MNRYAMILLSSGLLFGCSQNVRDEIANDLGTPEQRQELLTKVGEEAEDICSDMADSTGSAKEAMIAEIKKLEERYLAK